MTVMKTTGNNFKKVISQYFNERQQQAFKDVILYGGWGDATVGFSDGDAMGYGFITNDTSEGGHFKGREVTQVWSEISRIIKKTDAGQFLAHRNDYWGDGSGDVIFIRLDGFFKGDHDSFVEWAKTPVKQARPSAEERWGNYTRELKELEEKHLKETDNKVIREQNRRIASLKRKIERATKAIEKSLKNAEE